METKQQVDARKSTLKAEDALAIAKQVNEIYVAKGKKVVHLDLKQEQADREALTKLLLGPTGNLRAPTLRIGKTLVVGFDEETYQQALG